MKKIIIIIGLVVIVVIAITFNYIFKSNEVNTITEITIYKLAAKELFSKFEEDELKANELYLNKIIEVSGRIDQVKRNLDNEPVIILKEESEMFGIVCTLKQNIALNESTVGKHVKIKGLCQGYLTDVIINNCIILNYY